VRPHHKRIALLALVVMVAGWLAWTMLTADADLMR
jgi:hypothetical protein